MHKKVNTKIILIILAINIIFQTTKCNRYIPFFPNYYKGAATNNSNCNFNSFYLFGNAAFDNQTKATAEEANVSYIDLNGKVDLYKVAQNLQFLNLNNLIPLDWRWATDINLLFNSHLSGQGISIEGKYNISKNISFGFSTFFLSCNTQVNIQPTPNLINKLNLTTIANSELFTQMLTDFQTLANYKNNTWNATGISDINLYLNYYKSFKYKLNIKKIDFSTKLGFIFPSGIKSSCYYLSSIPFGSNGFYGYFISPSLELKLKDDCFFGASLKFEALFSKDTEKRIAINESGYLFSPLICNLNCNPGFTITFSPYLAFEDLNDGLGILLKYTLNYHQADYFSNKNATNLPINLTDLIKNSEYSQEYATIKVFYNPCIEKKIKMNPLLYISCDIPNNFIFGKGFAKTYKIQLGCSIKI